MRGNVSIYIFCTSDIVNAQGAVNPDTYTEFGIIIRRPDQVAVYDNNFRNNIQPFMASVGPDYHHDLLC